jgi:hypothetical protein
MEISYEEEFDLLEVIFNEKEHEHTNAGYELRHGLVIFVGKNFSLVQLTAVCFRGLTEQAAVRFDLLKKQPAKVRNKLLQLIAAPPLSSFLRIDAKTFYGRVMNPTILAAGAKPSE